MQTKFHGGNGILPLALGFAGAYAKLSIIGGPYDRRPPGMFGVFVRAEAPAPAHVYVPIHDFSIPRDAKVVESALVETFKAAIDGKQVYVGCMGGWGRTGLFLALMAKVSGVEAPISY